MARCSGSSASTRDITQQKQAEESLRQAYREVAKSREEALAVVGKLQVAHKELRQVQLQLIEAEKMKSIGRLAAGVAHEVKNPLGILKMGVDFLNDGRHPRRKRADDPARDERRRAARRSWSSAGCSISPPRGGWSSSPPI